MWATLVTLCPSDIPIKVLESIALQFSSGSRRRKSHASGRTTQWSYSGVRLVFSLLCSVISAHKYLAKDSELVRGNQDLRSQLKSRKECLAWLIQFINENTALIKVNTILSIGVERRWFVKLDVSTLSATSCDWRREIGRCVRLVGYP